MIHQNENKFLELVDFLKELGYKNVTSKLYKDLRHEILNENEKEIIYKDILKFLTELYKDEDFLNALKKMIKVAD